MNSVEFYITKVNNHNDFKLILLKDMLEFMDGGHFWLSQSPEKESKFETSAFPRIVSWLKLKHLENKRSFL